MSKPCSWNRIPDVTPKAAYHLMHRLDPIPEELPRPLTVYGNGRSYSDVGLTKEGSLLLTRDMNRLIEFDGYQGIIRCDAGITLAQLLEFIVPKGWFLPVTPGTRFATVGGCLANDVHGKNHHALGSFGHHVRAFELCRSDGSHRVCRPDDQEPWFAATIGGLGLTGLIRWVELQLISIENPWMWVASHRFDDLEAFWAMNASLESDWPYTVAWIDCLAKGQAQGRGIYLAGRHAGPQSDLPRYRSRNWEMPFDPPLSLVNSLSLKAFNQLYYKQKVCPSGKLVHHAPYFYPLDAIGQWNRIYGKKGFYQYQCVIPPHNAQAATSELLSTIAKRKQGSFLAVLKTFGEKPSLGLLSFPRPGTTLALDFPNKGQATLDLLADLDAIVLDAGGALYPAKDARMPAAMFRASFSDWEAFTPFIDPAFSSHFWQRVSL